MAVQVKVTPIYVSDKSPVATLPVMNNKRNTLLTIGLIGLGNLSNPLAVSALTNGYKMVLHSLDKNEAANLIALDAIWVDTPRRIRRQVRRDVSRQTLRTSRRHPLWRLSVF
ncbi:MAG: NAD(P)-binding domain-containing protein [Ilumatobacteraceae bacterium]|nr:NAD(P)-binding domain-containing protein [Ilumatobacteraceae bacterium]MDP4981619.1 NAD(P)-binding domain-containing protein [Ilumatobacteraceae bacterium]